MKQRLRRLPVVLIALVALVSVGMAACGDDDDDVAGDTTTTVAAEGSPSIDVEMADYSFVVSGPVVAGGTIAMSNTGDEMHMMALGRLRPGRTLADVVEMLEQQFGEEGDDEDEADTTTTTAAAGATTVPEGAEEDEGDPFDELMEEVGVPGAFLLPDSAIEVTVPDLEAGTYAMLCFISTEGSGEPHVARGMVGELTVVEGTAPTLTPDATYQVEAGEAVEGPTTLQAGRRVLKIEASGAGAGDLEPMLVKPEAGRTLSQVNREINEMFETEVPERGAGRGISADYMAVVFDLGDNREIYLTVDLTPGTWELIVTATDEDDEVNVAEAPERITITVT